MKLHTATLVASEALGDNIFRLQVEQPELAQQAVSGQIVMVDCDNIGTVRRPFSIGRVLNEPNRFEMWVKAVGAGSRWLTSRPPGTQLDMIGPLGKGFTTPTQKNVLVLIEDRHVTPVLRLLDTLSKNPEMNTHLAVVGDAPLQAHRRLQSEMEPAGIRVFSAYGEREQAEKQIMQYIAEHNIEHIAAACSKDWVKPLVDLDRAGKAYVEISLEIQMVCGIGACLGCTYPLYDEPDQSNQSKFTYQPLCSQGPVVRARRVVI